MCFNDDYKGLWITRHSFIYFKGLLILLTDEVFSKESDGVNVNDFIRWCNFINVQ